MTHRGKLRREADTGPPPWWAWFEPPRWFPDWLHLLTCTFCRGMRGHVREVRRG